MTNKKHTAAPWQIIERGHSEGYCDIDDCEETTVVASISKNYARRIVACVNRCESVDTETLENAPDLATAFMSAENARLMQVNAELLAAAKQTIEENLYLADGDNCTLKVLKDAIAKAEAI